MAHQVGEPEGLSQRLARAVKALGSDEAESAIGAHGAKGAASPNQRWRGGRHPVGNAEGLVRCAPQLTAGVAASQHESAGRRFAAIFGVTFVSTRPTRHGISSPQPLMTAAGERTLAGWETRCGGLEPLVPRLQILFGELVTGGRSAQPGAVRTWRLLGILRQSTGGREITELASNIAGGAPLRRAAKRWASPASGGAASRCWMMSAGRTCLNAAVKPLLRGSRGPCIHRPVPRPSEPPLLRALRSGIPSRGRGMPLEMVKSPVN